MREEHKKVTEKYPMSKFQDHWNPGVRLLEWNRQRIIKSMVGDCLGKVVADIGCEEGGLSWTYSKYAKWIYLVDADERVLNVAYKKIRGLTGTYTVVCPINSDAEDIDIQDNTCDVVLCCALLEHIPNPNYTLSEIFRILKPGGKVIINVPNDYTTGRIKAIIRRLRLGFLISGFQEGVPEVHLHKFNRKKIVSMVRKYGRILYYRDDLPFLCNHFVKMEKLWER